MRQGVILVHSRTKPCTAWNRDAAGAMVRPRQASDRNEAEHGDPMDYLLPIVINLVILALIWGAGSDWLRRNEAYRPRPHHHHEHH